MNHQNEHYGTFRSLGLWNKAGLLGVPFDQNAAINTGNISYVIWPYISNTAIFRSSATHP